MLVKCQTCGHPFIEKDWIVDTQVVTMDLQGRNLQFVCPPCALMQANMKNAQTPEVFGDA